VTATVLDPGARLSNRQLAAVFAALAAALALVTARAGSDVARAAVGGLVLVVFAFVALSSRTIAVVTMVVWLLALGFTRRLLIPFAGWAENDPLLLVSPAAAVILLATTRDRRPPPRSALAPLVAFLFLWTLAGIVNPNERSVREATQAALFIVTPYLWFFVGRSLTEREHDLVLDAFFWAAIGVAVHGLYQTFVGFLPFELTWFHVSGTPPALILIDANHFRPFSTLVSPQEYGLVMAFAGLHTLARILHRRPHRGWLWALFGVFSVALFFQASRGILLAYLLGIVVLIVARMRSLTFTLGLAAGGVAFLLALQYGFDLVPPTARDADTSARSTAAALYHHQISGLFNPTSSTAGLHGELVLNAFVDGLRNPLGVGPSRSSLASFKAGTTTQASPENEVAITIVALGIPAAVALAGLYVSGILGARRLNRARPSVRHLTWLALLVAVGDQALNGRLYATSVLVALIYGGVATELARLRERAGARTLPSVPDA
jgi:hypothetical protein